MILHYTELGASPTWFTHGARRFAGQVWQHSFSVDLCPPNLIQNQTYLTPSGARMPVKSFLVSFSRKDGQTCFARLDMPAYVNRGLEPIQEDLCLTKVDTKLQCLGFFEDASDAWFIGHAHIRSESKQENREFLVHSMSSNKTMLGNSEVQEDNVFQFQARTWQHALPHQKGYLSACREHASFTCPLYSLTIPEVFALPKTLKAGMVPPFHYHYLAWKVPPYTIPGSHKKLPVDSGIHLGSSKSMEKPIHLETRRFVVF